MVFLACVRSMTAVSGVWRLVDEGANLTPFSQSQPLIKSQSFDGQTRISKSTFQWSKMKP